MPATNVDNSKLCFFFAVASICFHIWLCPFNKVEESFNMQAVHDILYIGNNISQYDHIFFPGVVPRTFLGPLILSMPCVFLRPFISKTALQLVVRAILGILGLHAMNSLAVSFKSRLRPLFGSRFLLITFTQFHIVFYSSRTLPNTFAFATVMYALGSLLRGLDCQFIMLSGLGILVFRCELMLLYAPLLIFGLYFQFVKIRPVLIATGLLTTVVAISVTVLVDSYFWQRWLWPEGEVFYFNAVENKSHLWGTMPFLWYFFNALPKSLVTTLGLVLCSNVVLIFSSSSKEFNRDRQVLLGLELVALTFITIYSFLPHKELRFIIYVIPIFNLVAAYFWDYVEFRLRMCRNIKATGQARFGNMKGHQKQTSSIMHRIYWVAVFLCYASLFVNLCASFGLLYCSSYNYPGGEAISKLNTWPGLAERRDVHVFISNLAAQTGVNRFQQVHAHWIYNKTEHVDDDTDALVKGPFTHFIVEASKDTLAARTDAFRRLFTVISFSGIKYIPENTFWSKLKVFLVPALVVYERINQI